MKTIGIIGGISWHSTAVYYTLMNKQIQAALGGHNAAKIVLYSVNYNDFKQLQKNNDWKAIGLMLSNIAIRLQHAGADCIILACNTAHLVADSITKSIQIPFIHIATSAIIEIKKRNMQSVGILGTKFVMEKAFFTDLLKLHGITPILPAQDDRDFVHNSILTEMANGSLHPNTKSRLLEIINQLSENGAEAILFACTEIGLFIQINDINIPMLDTTVIHSNAAVAFALS